MAHACSGICVVVGVLLGFDSDSAPSEVNLRLNAVLPQDALNNICGFLISKGEMGGNLAAVLQETIGGQCAIINKGTALRRILQDPDISSKNCMVFGDNDNALGRCHGDVLAASLFADERRN